MRTLITITCAAFIGCIIPAKAESLSAQCKAYGEYARTVMGSRQQEMPMSKLIDLIDASRDMDEAGKNVLRSLIIAAYEQPAFSTEKYKRNAVASFGNAAEVSCYKGATR
jgi:hypothetical protein